MSKKNVYHPNNFKVPGTKLKSRFGYSHSASRAITREQARFYAGAPKDYYDPEKHYNLLSKRQAKKCKHEKMVDDSYGGPESGRISAHCPKCGYSFSHILY